MPRVSKVRRAPASRTGIPDELDCPICGARIFTLAGLFGDDDCYCSSCGYGIAGKSYLRENKEIQKFVQYKRTGGRKMPWSPQAWTGLDGKYEIKPVVGQGGNLVWRRREKWTSGRYSGQLSQNCVTYYSYKEAANASHKDVVELLRAMRTREKVTPTGGSQSSV